jgi:arylsulfatase A-like enzyme
LLSANAASAQPAPGSPGKKPNIVFILMDNLGYGEVGVYGGGITRGAPTPRVDRLATEGTRLTNFNVEAQCTPSRSAFMTGRFSIRSGTHSVPIGGGVEGLTQWEVTIAEALSAAGYATGAFGKWHLGSEQGRLPNDQGFDEWYGIPRTRTRLSGHRTRRQGPQAFRSSTSWKAAKERRAASLQFTIWSSAA